MSSGLCCCWLRGCLCTCWYTILHHCMAWKGQCISMCVYTLIMCTLSREVVMGNFNVGGSRYWYDIAHLNYFPPNLPSLPHPPISLSPSLLPFLPLTPSPLTDSESRVHSVVPHLSSAAQHCGGPGREAGHQEAGRGRHCVR